MACPERESFCVYCLLPMCVRQDGCQKCVRCTCCLLCTPLYWCTLVSDLNVAKSPICCKKGRCICCPCELCDPCDHDCECLGRALEKRRCCECLGECICGRFCCNSDSFVCRACCPTYAWPKEWLVACSCCLFIPCVYYTMMCRKGCKPCCGADCVCKQKLFCMCCYPCLISMRIKEKKETKARHRQERANALWLELRKKRFEETEAMRENLLREATVERERVALAPDRRQSMLDLSLAAAMKPSMEQMLDPTKGTDFVLRGFTAEMYRHMRKQCQDQGMQTEDMVTPGVFPQVPWDPFSEGRKPSGSGNGGDGGGGGAGPSGSSSAHLAEVLAAAAAADEQEGGGGGPSRANDFTWDRGPEGMQLQHSGRQLVQGPGRGGSYRLNYRMESGRHRMYFQCTRVDTSKFYPGVGVMTESFTSYSTWLKESEHGWVLEFKTGQLGHARQRTGSGTVVRDGNIVVVIVDADARTVDFEVDGEQHSVHVSGLPRGQALYPAASTYSPGDTITFLHLEELS